MCEGGEVGSGARCGRRPRDMASGYGQTLAERSASERGTGSPIQDDPRGRMVGVTLDFELVFREAEDPP